MDGGLRTNDNALLTTPTPTPATNLLQDSHLVAYTCQVYSAVDSADHCTTMYLGNKPKTLNFLYFLPYFRECCIDWLTAASPDRVILRPACGRRCGCHPCWDLTPLSSPCDFTSRAKAVQTSNSFTGKHRAEQRLEDLLLRSSPRGNRNDSAQSWRAERDREKRSWRQR